MEEPYLSPVIVLGGNIVQLICEAQHPPLN